MLFQLLIFAIALFLVIQGATMATTYAGRLAESFHLSKYTVGFIVVAVISILPETFIAINSALEGIPSFGLATLFGSNIADLTLIFALIMILGKRKNLKVESKILKNHLVYPFILLFPLILGLNGYFSRLEGLAIIMAGIAFYYIALKNGSVDGPVEVKEKSSRLKNILMLLLTMALLLIGAHFTVTSGTELASYFGVSPILIGMLVVGLGTTMPELFFALKSVKKHDDSLAIGDILGTVLADATIVVGLIALITPFSFPPKIIYITGIFMVIAAILLFYCMKNGRHLTRNETYLLLVFWLTFVVVEFIANR